MKIELFIILVVIGAAAAGIVNGIVTKSVAKGIATALFYAICDYIVGATGVWHPIAALTIGPIISITADLMRDAIKKNPRT